MMRDKRPWCQGNFDHYYRLRDDVKTYQSLSSLGGYKMALVWTILILLGTGKAIETGAMFSSHKQCVQAINILYEEKLGIPRIAVHCIPRDENYQRVMVNGGHDPYALRKDEQSVTE
jgi:hypothetical protein